MEEFGALIPPEIGAIVHMAAPHRSLRGPGNLCGKSRRPRRFPAVHTLLCGGTHAPVLEHGTT